MPGIGWSNRAGSHLLGWSECSLYSTTTQLGHTLHSHNLTYGSDYVEVSRISYDIVASLIAANDHVPRALKWCISHYALHLSQFTVRWIFKRRCAKLQSPIQSHIQLKLRCRENGTVAIVKCLGFISRCGAQKCSYIIDFLLRKHKTWICSVSKHGA